jgi:broad specificity phosphatase PhoE
LANARSVVLCRHGATEQNVAGHFLSTADPSLTPQGRVQAEQLRTVLQNFAFDRCLVSPMRRCLETRELIAPALPFEVHIGLREVDFGEWEGKTLEWLARNDAERLAQRRRAPVEFRPPGGESFRDVAPRLRSVIATIETGGGTLVIGHRGTLGVLERLLRGLPLDSTSVTPLEPGEFRTL